MNLIGVSQYDAYVKEPETQPVRLTFEDLEPDASDDDVLGAFPGPSAGPGLVDKVTVVVFGLDLPERLLAV